MRDKLQSWLEVETDEKALSLIRELISVYKELEVERSKNSRIVSLIARRNAAINNLTDMISAHNEERDRMIELAKVYDKNQEENTKSFKQMYWLANFSKSPLFSSKMLLQLWKEVADLFNAKTTEEAEDAQSKIVVTLADLEADELMRDARDSVLFYEKYNSEEERVNLIDDTDLEEIIKNA